MEQVLLVIQVLLAVALIGMVLIQRSESDGFGLGGGSGNNLLTGRGVANLMTRTTAILAALFMANSLALSVLAARGHAPSIIEQIEKDKAGNAVPAVPLAGDGKDNVTMPKETGADVNAKEKTASKVPVASDAAPIEKEAGEKVPAPAGEAQKVAKPAKKSAEEAPAETIPDDSGDTE